MADPKIYIRRSATPNKVPTTDQLALGELAINTNDGKLYLEQDPNGVGIGTTVICVNPFNVGVGSLAYDINFTAGSVGIGTDDVTTAVGSNNTSVLAVGIATAYKFYGDGSSLTGIAGTVFISSSAPSSPKGGDLWWNSDVGELYVYYSDGDSNQWVETAGGSDTSPSYWVATTVGIHTLGSVGIGTTNPSAELEVRSTADAPTLTWNGSGQTIIGDTANQLSIGRVNSSPFGLYLQARASNNAARDILLNPVGGDVGIGTVNPDRLLHLGSTGAPVIKISDYDTGAPAPSYAEMSFNGGNMVFSADAGNVSGSTRIAFEIDGSEKARIDSSGRLLVGPSSARSNFQNSAGTAAFQIEGTSQATSAASIVRNNATFGPILRLARSAGTTVGSNTILTSANPEIGVINFEGNDGSEFVIGAQVRAEVDGTPGANDMPGRIIFSTTADGAASPTERMRLTSSGNFGLGASNPGYRLDIQAADTTANLGYAMRLRENSTAGAATLQFTDSGVTVERGYIACASGNLNLVASSSMSFATNGSTPDVTIDSSGRLGIGTASPGDYNSAFRNFVIANHSGFCGMTIRSANNSEGTVAFADGITGSEQYRGYLQYNHTSDYLRIGVSGSEVARFTSAGRLGIGIDNPSYMLDVVKDNAGGTTALRVKNGNVAANSDAKLYLDTANGSWELTALRSGGRLSFGISNSEKAAIDQNGRLLVGTTSASGTPRVDIVGNSSSSTGQGVLQLRRGSDALFNGDALGQLFFGDTISGGNARAAINAYADGTGGTGDMPTRLSFHTTADGASSYTERMRITNSGDVGINVLNPSAGASATSGLAIRPGNHDVWFNHANGVSSGTAYAYFSYNSGAIGSITQNGTTAVAYNTTSDYRLKENVIPVTDGIYRLQQLKPSKFNFIADPDRTVDGFIAHEVQTVVPEAITGEKDAVDDQGSPVYQGIDQSKLVPLLTAALQEAISKIEVLEAKVAALEGN